MYLADRFNESGLFQNLGGLQEEIKIDYKKEEIFKEFLFRASSAYLILWEMENLNQKCIKEYFKREDMLNVKSQRIAFWSPDLVELLNQITPFFTTMRILQNSILKLLSLKENLATTPPKSLNDAIGHLEKYGLRENISEIISNYWNNGGREV
jgi:hypothetical protein